MFRMQMAGRNEMGLSRRIEVPKQLPQAAALRRLGGNSELSGACRDSWGLYRGLVAESARS